MSDKDSSVRPFERSEEAEQVEPGGSGGEGAAGMRSGMSIGAGMGGSVAYDPNGAISTSMDETSSDEDPAQANRSSTGGRGE